MHNIIKSAPGNNSFAEELSELITEQSNSKTERIDECTTEEMLYLINNEDKQVPLAVEKEIVNIAKAVEVISKKLAFGGRLFYVGAGTSGRLGILDASECPPTYGVSPELIQGVIAGGESAVFKAVEDIEDSKNVGRQDMEQLNISDRDVVLGIAASGRTPYVLGAVEEAKRCGAFTIGLCNLPSSPLSAATDLSIEVVVGPEAITGSTRMKSGTAQKMVLNMLSTCSMIKLGKVYNNRMVDLQATNSKLRERSIRMIIDLTGTSREQAISVLDQCGDNVKLAVMKLKSRLSMEDAQRLLNEHHGHLKQSLQHLNK